MFLVYQLVYEKNDKIQNIAIENSKHRPSFRGRERGESTKFNTNYFLTIINNLEGY